MDRTNGLLVTACTGVLLCLLTVVGLDALGLGGPLVGPGETLHVQLVDSETLGVVAGLARTEATTFFGLGATTTTPTTGWVALVPAGQQAPSPDTVLTVTDDMAFTDPNGGTWLGREVSYDDGVAWVVPLGATLYDATIEAEYNFALVVDWDKVPSDGVAVTVLDHVTLA